MKKLALVLVAGIVMTAITACSVFGENNVEVAPYKTLRGGETFELRHYESIVLARAPMPGGVNGQNDAFFKLFDYISGENETAQKIEMTAPVFMGLDESEYMQFVLPSRYTMETAPLPTGADVELEEVRDLSVAVITFSGRLSKDNIDKNRELLEAWIADQPQLETAGEAIAAGYNGPMTIPALRRNEVLIPVTQKRSFD